MWLGAEKINAVNYLDKPLPTNDECYYALDTYAVNEQTGGFRPSAQGSNQDNWRQGRNYGNYNCEGLYVWDGNYNRDNNFNRGNYANRNDRNGPMSLLKIVKLLLGMVEVVWPSWRYVA